MNEQKRKFFPIKMSELMDKKLAPVDWLVEDLIPSGCITAICGYAGCYKTWMMLEIAISSAQGRDFLEKFKTKKEKILIIDEETGERDLRERLKLLNADNSMEIEILCLADFDLYGTDEIVKYCLDNKIGVVMIDSLIRVHKLKDENSSAEAAKIWPEFKKFKKNGITLILLHHNRKSGSKQGDSGEELRGSSEIFAFLDCAISLHKKKDEITIRQTKLRITKESEPFITKVIEGDNSISFEFMGYTEGQDSQNKSEIAEEQILALLAKDNVGIFRQAIFAALNEECTDYAIKKAIKSLLACGKIDCTSGGKGNSSMYFIKHCDELVEKLLP